MSLLPQNVDRTINNKEPIRMLIYGEPGVGKSFFATKADSPLFLSTDGNYVYHSKPATTINTMDTFSKAVNEIVSGKHTFKTIVVDLLEDVYRWYRHDLLEKKGIEHEGDLGYGKGWDLIRTTFLSDIFKLLSTPYDMIFISHSTMITVKDRRGVEHHSFRPSNFLPEKVLDVIEGRMRFVCRAYYKVSDTPGGIKQTRMLSLIPKSNEYGVIRLDSTDNIPEDIELDWNIIKNVIYNKSTKTDVKIREIKKVEQLKVEEVVLEQPKEEPKAETKKIGRPKGSTTKGQPKVEEQPKEDLKVEEVTIPIPEVQTIKEETKIEKVVLEQPKEEPKVISDRDKKLAEIRAKLEAMKNGGRK